MIELWQEFTIEASHSLPQPIGKPVLHGHSYWIRIYVETEESNVVPQPMLNGLCQQIKHRLDHTNLNDLMEEPTMEGIAKWIVRNWGGPGIVRIKINRPSIGCGIDYWLDASAAAFWRAKHEHTQGECRHLKKSNEHAWKALEVANNRLEQNGIERVWSPSEK